MDRVAPNPDAMASAILEAPAWARVGIAAPSETVRERAAAGLVSWLLEHLEVRPEPSADQLTLAL